MVDRAVIRLVRGEVYDVVTQLDPVNQILPVSGLAPRGVVGEEVLPLISPIALN